MRISWRIWRPNDAKQCQAQLHGRTPAAILIKGYTYFRLDRWRSRSSSCSNKYNIIWLFFMSAWATHVNRLISCAVLPILEMDRRWTSSEGLHECWRCFESWSSNALLLTAGASFENNKLLAIVTQIASRDSVDEWFGDLFTLVNIILFFVTCQFYIM